MRINIECGDNYADGWMNVSSDFAVNADMRARADRLPVPDGMAEMVYLGHTLENYDGPGVHRVLHEARRVLQPGGFVVVLYPAYSIADQQWNQYAWDMINSGFKTNRIAEYLSEEQRFTGRATYTAVSEVFPESVSYLACELVPEWPVGAPPPWLCAVLASKPR
jgi:SAM-dependent methyltransferase